MAFGLHILLADRDPDQAALLARYLLDQGHHVQTTSNGLQVVPAVRDALSHQTPYDLIFLAQRLAGMDAIECLEHLVGLGRHAPPSILLVSPRGIERSVEAHVRQLGCQHLLPTPVDLANLQKLIDRFMGFGSAQEIPFFGTSTRVVNRNSHRGSGNYRTIGSGNHPAIGTGTHRPVTGVHQPATGAQAPVSGNQGRTDADFSPPRNDVPRQSATEVNPITGNYTTSRQRPPSSGTGYQRQPSAFDISPALGNPAIDPGSGRHRRSESYAGSYGRGPKSTATYRRSITGRLENDAIQGSSGHMRVRCAHCGESFAVPRRAEPFNVMCIHCGKLNRIPASIPPQSAG